MSRIDSLISFVNSHDNCSAKDGGDGTLIVTGLWSVPGDGMYRAVTRSEVIPATLEAVEAWLGY